MLLASNYLLINILQKFQTVWYSIYCEIII